MNAAKRRSKKRSDASSQWRPDEPVLFLDRNLGKHVIAERLRAAGLEVEVHDDHLPSDAPDEDWIALVGKKGWVALTKDKNIRHRFAEIESIKRHAARIIVIRAKNATGPEIADAVVVGSRRIVRFTARNAAPFVARIDRRGTVTPYPGVLESNC